MALEYLQNGHLTIMSDVWSYGVVLWEIFSFGKEPYINVNVEDMLPQFKSGYHPPCPDEASKVHSIESNTLQSVFQPSAVKIGPILLTESWLQERVSASLINVWISMGNWWGGSPWLGILVG